MPDPDADPTDFLPVLGLKKQKLKHKQESSNYINDLLLSKIILQKAVLFFASYSLINSFIFFFCPMSYTLKEGCGKAGVGLFSQAANDRPR